MPPKSSNKKSQAIWYNCEQCKATITSKDRDNHDKICSTDATAYTTFDYIKDHCLYTTNLSKKSFAIDELTDIPDKFANNLIFISEGVLRLCEFRIGQPVLIRLPTKPDLAPIARSIWPIPDKFLSTVFVCGRDYEENWRDYQSAQLCIMKLPSKAIPAKLVKIKCIHDFSIQRASVHDVEVLLLRQMKDLIFTIGNKVYLHFFNKLLKFEVTSWSSRLDESSLEDRFESLELSEQFFTVLASTSIEVDKESECDEVNVDQTPRVDIRDIGGLTGQIKLVQEAMNIALGYQQTLSGVKVSRGILLFGPSGCGKTMILEALSSNSPALTIRINASELFSKFLGETEKNLNQHFDQAFRNHPKPSLIIIEDVHNLCPRNETNDVVKRVSVAFFSTLDSLATRKEASKLFIIATTGNIEHLNPGVRRCGRLDCEVEISAPSPTERRDILQRHLSKVDHDLSNDFIKEMADVTHGFVGSDLANLIYTAGIATVKSGRTKLQPDDISYALNQVKPSAMREVLIENPNVKWTDIGGQDGLKLKLKQAIEWPLQHPEKFLRLGIKPPRGILMFGPPGCSKTMIAKALATESKVNFLSIKGPELFSMWVGESERAVREVFRKARQVAPSIIFFDEIDAIGGERSTDGGGTSVKERVLTQLLTELDGVNALKDVTIVAATNRPDMIDKALLRPGRIDRIVYVGLPDEASRREIFRIKLSNMPLAEDVDVDELVSRTKGYSGAEIQAVCHEAALKVLEQSFESEFVTWREFEFALRAVQPRTTPELLQLYDEYIKQS